MGRKEAVAAGPASAVGGVPPPAESVGASASDDADADEGAGTFAAVDAAGALVPALADVEAPRWIIR